MYLSAEISKTNKQTKYMFLWIYYSLLPSGEKKPYPSGNQKLRSLRGKQNIGKNLIVFSCAEYILV